jgi:hypothetical protein
MIQRSFGLLCDETSAVEKVCDILNVLLMWMQLEINQVNRCGKIWEGDGRFCLEFHMSETEQLTRSVVRRESSQNVV